jgi:hypothetical protein
VLKAHIQQLNSMLIMSYQNSAAYFADAGLGTPTTGSSRPYTPINGPLELPSYELSTPNGELDLSIEVDGDTTNGQNEENHAGTHLRHDQQLV